MLMFLICHILLFIILCGILFFFCKHKTAYEMRISDWSSDVCSSDLFASFTIESAPLHYCLSLPFCFLDALAISILQRSLATDTQKPPSLSSWSISLKEIGRASCRERVCQYV